MLQPPEAQVAYGYEVTPGTIVCVCLCDHTWAGVGGYDNDAMFLSWELTSCFGYEILLRASQACRNNRTEFFLQTIHFTTPKAKRWTKKLLVSVAYGGPFMSLWA